MLNMSELRARIALQNAYQDYLYYMSEAHKRMERCKADGWDRSDLHMFHYHNDRATAAYHEASTCLWITTGRHTLPR